MPSELDSIIEELRYVNYRCNREASPHIAPERWSAIYPNVPLMEARFQCEKAITKAKETA